MTEKNNSKNSNKDFMQSLKQNLEGKKPRSKSYFLGMNLLVLSLIIGLILGLGIVLGFAFWDTLSVASTGLEFVLFEVFAVVFVLLILLFFIYRQTDFLLVKHRVLVFSILAVLVLSIGGLTIIASQQNPEIERGFEKFQGGVERLPHRQNRGQRMGKKKRENGIFRGRIIKIKSEVRLEDLRQNKIPQIPANKLDSYNLITLQNRRKVQTFLIKKEVTKDSNLELNRQNTRQRPQDFRVDFERRVVLGVED